MFKKIPFLKVFSFLLVAGVGLGLFNPFDVAHAESEVLEALAKLLALFIDLLVFLALLALDVTGPLFGNVYLTNPDFLDEAVRPMWIFVRNIVNLFFVAVIMVIAIGNLYSSVAGNGSWTIKEKLPRLIAAMILINFSLLGVLVILDAVYVGTVAMFSISDTALEDKTTKQLLFEVDLCEGKALEHGYFKTPEECQAILDPQGKHDPISFANVMNSLLCDNNSDGNVADCPIAFLSDARLKSELQNDPTDPGRNVMVAVGSQMMHLEVLPMVAAKGEDGIYDVFRLLNSVTFSFILAFAYCLALVALWIGMLLRTIYIWVVMIASPLIVADIVLGLGFTGNEKNRLINTFIMPIKAAAAFAVGFVLVANINSIKINEQVGGFVDHGVGNTKFGEFGLDILWQVATVIIFWVAIWAAFKETIAEGVVKHVQNFGESLGKLALKGAGNIPLGPTVKRNGEKVPITANSLNPLELVNSQIAKANRIALDTRRALTENTDGVTDLSSGLTRAFGTSNSYRDVREGLQEKPVSFDVTEDRDIDRLIDAIKDSKLGGRNELVQELQKIKGIGDEGTRRDALKNAFKAADDTDGVSIAESLLDGRGRSNSSPSTPPANTTVNINPRVSTPAAGASTTEVQFSGSEGAGIPNMTLEKSGDNWVSQDGDVDGDIATAMNQTDEKAEIIRRLFGDGEDPSQYTIEIDHGNGDKLVIKKN